MAFATKDKTTGKYPKMGRRANVTTIAETIPAAGRKMV
jgi:hypothetical protein